MADEPTTGATDPQQGAAPTAEEQRAALDKRIEQVHAEEQRLLAERRALNKQLRAQGHDEIADLISGPVVPDEPTPAPAPEPAPKHAAPLIATATPSAQQVAKAGKGILRKNGEHISPNFVSLLGHTVTRTTATYAVLCAVAGAFMVPLFISLAVQAGTDISDGGNTGNLFVTLVVFAVECLLLFGLCAGFPILALRMVRGEDKGRLHLVEVMVVEVSGVILCHLMVFGMTSTLVIYGLVAALLIALHSYWDPELALERANRKTDTESLRDMIRSTSDERTVVPGKRSGKGYITLNFFNIFWIFTIASVLGLIVETVTHLVIFHAYQDRAGMLWGPLSPIYGFGALLMTIALNRFHDKPWWFIFLVSAVIGGAFEFFTSWFLQTAFGITAWDYSGTFLNIDGRTNFMYMCCWGALGLVWVKLFLPVMLWFVKKIPWGWRYTLTTICAILMIFDGAATLVAIDCWYLREAGVPETTPIEKFCAVHYDNSYMEDRFQTMSMDVKSTARTK